MIARNPCPANSPACTLARGIADLAASPDIQAGHLAEAVNCCSLDRQLFA